MTDQLPTQCYNLEKILPTGGQFIFNNKSWLPYTMMGFYFIIYCIPIVYIHNNRNKPSFSTRSPKLINVCFTLMMLNSILSTIWMTKNELKSSLWTF